MKISISNKSVVGEIKRQFSLEYPFLKIEFLIPHRPSFKPDRQVIASDNSTLGHLQPAMKEGTMIVDDMTTVGELENFFKKSFTRCTGIQTITKSLVGNDNDRCVEFAKAKQPWKRNFGIQEYYQTKRELWKRFRERCDLKKEIPQLITFNQGYLPICNID